MLSWVKVPLSKIRDDKEPLLAEFRWGHGFDGAAHVAALMVYIALLHRTTLENPKDGLKNNQVKLSYDQLGQICGLSRAKIAAGLKILFEHNLIQKIESRYSLYEINTSNIEKGWGKLPAKRLYKNQKIVAFQEFTLRKKTELNALKIYLLVIAYRQRKTNTAEISYTSITKYTGIHRNDIVKANSLLINLGLIRVEAVDSIHYENRSSNSYRICHLEPYQHRGTTERPTI